MKHHDLKNIIIQLQRLRDDHCNQLDASALADLDDVLHQLKKLLESDKRETPLGELSIRVLNIISNVLRLVTNITDLMQ